MNVTLPSLTFHIPSESYSKEQTISMQTQGKLRTEIEFAVLVCLDVLPVELIASTSATSSWRTIVKAHPVLCGRSLLSEIFLI